ncbi:hypothetical protein EMIT036CA2_20569 [Chryseobacterium sp. IT-36CA2]
MLYSLYFIIRFQTTTNEFKQFITDCDWITSQSLQQRFEKNSERLLSELLIFKI